MDKEGKREQGREGGKRKQRLHSYAQGWRTEEKEGRRKRGGGRGEMEGK